MAFAPFRCLARVERDALRPCHHASTRTQCAPGATLRVLAERCTNCVAAFAMERQIPRVHRRCTSTLAALRHLVKTAVQIADLRITAVYGLVAELEHDWRAPERPNEALGSVLLVAECRAQRIQDSLGSLAPISSWCDWLRSPLKFELDMALLSVSLEQASSQRALSSGATAVGESK